MCRRIIDDRQVIDTVVIDIIICPVLAIIAFVAFDFCFFIAVIDNVLCYYHISALSSFPSYFVITVAIHCKNEKPNCS